MTTVKTKPISARIDSDTYSYIQNYVKQNGFDSPSDFVKELIEKHRSSNQNVAIALLGKNQIEYSPRTSRFTWKILTNSTISPIISEDLTIEFLKDLKEEIDKAIAQRNKFVHGNNKSEIPIDILNKKIIGGKI